MKVTVEHDGQRIVVEPGGQEWTGSGVAGRLIKAEWQHGYTLALAYPANRPDIGIARDGHRDFVGPDALREAAWSYLKESPIVGLWHEDGTEGAGEVVESFLWPDGAPDWKVARAPDLVSVSKSAGMPEPVISSGDWLMGIVWNEEARALIASGKVRGLSPQGSARRRVPTRTTTAALRS